jgi:hypothetical protein
LLSVKHAKPDRGFITGKGNMTIFFSAVPLSNPHCKKRKDDKNGKRI